MALRRYQKAILLIKDLCSNSAVAGFYQVRRYQPVDNELVVAYTADMQPVEFNWGSGVYQSVGVVYLPMNII